MTVLLILGLVVVAWAVAELWWAGKGVRCDCAHRWASAIGDSKAREVGGRLYRCIRCQRLLERRAEEWPPVCSEEGGRARDCAWPLCQPIRGPRDLPGRARHHAKRLIVWHGIDAPE